MRKRLSATATAVTIAVATLAPVSAGAATAPASGVGAHPTSSTGTAVGPIVAQFRLLPKREARKRPKLRRGSSGIWVKRVQRALRARPYDGVFGRGTGRSVKRFRQSQGLKARKVVNTRTWRKLGSRVKVRHSASRPAPAPAPTNTTYPTLQRGSGHTAWVVALQRALGVSADGDFGPNTESAVKSFQTSHGLSSTGIVDAATWSALGSSVTPPGTDPSTDPTTTIAAQTDRNHRSSLGISAFVNSPTAQNVVFRESRGNCSVVSANGLWAGKWQMDAQFWSYYGGRSYATSPDKATCADQDIVAFAGWVDRWWTPWSTA